MNLLGLEVPLTAVGVGDHDLLGSRLQRPLDGGIQVARHQPPPDLILFLVTADLCPVDYARYPLHIYGDEDTLRLVRQILSQMIGLRCADKIDHASTCRGFLKRMGAPQ